MSTGTQPTVDLTADWLSSALSDQNNLNFFGAGSVLAYLQGQVGPQGPPLMTWDQAVAAWQEYIRQLEIFLAECQRRGIPLEGTPPEMRVLYPPPSPLHSV